VVAKGMPSQVWPGTAFFRLGGGENMKKQNGTRKMSMTENGEESKGNCRFVHNINITFFGQKLKDFHQKK
jgi:hypothetical protein